MRRRIGIVSPDDSREGYAERAVELCGLTPVVLDPGARTLDDVDAVLVLGGNVDSRVVTEMVARAGRGLPVLGIGDGFRLLCDTGVLPGRLETNESGRYACVDQRVLVHTNDTVWTAAMERQSEVTLVVNTGAGRFVVDADTAQQLADDDRVVARYVDGNPTGSTDDIAGITNAAGNVVGLLPDLALCVDELTGPSTDGRAFIGSVGRFLALRQGGPVAATVEG
ncbi:phosphoribosylformylglycinamidine synthase subunit PurQ [Ammonicoccus fulvus]|uniref:Phosphoribosylformylglycinamidine synthase subunit PurQ n=1 Tax=Ammonicoccus fulvus TaxID=3138240 RepID=A0ABZ3FN03_9ACTN